MCVEEKLEVHKARVDVVVIIAKVDELSGGSSHCESGEAPYIEWWIRWRRYG